MRRLRTGRAALALALTTAAAIAGASVLLTAAGSARPYRASTAVLAGTVSRLVSIAQGRGELARSRRIQVALPLRLPGSAALDRLVAGQYTPGSPSYRHFLTPAEFGR